MGRWWISYRAFKGPYGVDLRKTWTALRSLSIMLILAGIHTYGDRMPCYLMKSIYRILEV